MIQPRSKVVWTNEIKSRIYSCWDTVRIFYIVLKVSGFIAYSIDGRIENGKIKTRVMDIAMLSLCLFTYLAVFYINFKFDLTLISTKSPTIDIGNRLIHYYIIINVFLTTFIHFIWKYPVWEIFQSFSEFDKDVSFLNSFSFHTTLSCCLLFADILSLVECNPYECEKISLELIDCDKI